MYCVDVDTVQHCSHKITFKVSVCAQLKLSTERFMKLVSVQFSHQRCVMQKEPEKGFDGSGH